jgi:glycosyltransferase involved in cell wall biosynthesis
VNGRFLTQPLSGVQRFAFEITGALQRMEPTLRPFILVPPTLDQTASPLPIVKVGHRRGVAWEQLDLPTHTLDGILVNLGNTAPLRLRRQIIVIHDAAVYSLPKAYSWAFRRWYSVMQKLLVWNGVQVVTVSPFSREELSHYLHVTEESIGLISEGADHMERIIPDNSILLRNDLEPGRFVLAVGNLAPHKNLAALNLTARVLAERQMPLVVVGGQLAIFAQESTGVPHPAKYLGRVSDEELRALYGAAACFVYPTLYEGFGLPVVEAMMCGCPVVTSQIPVLRETCGDAALFCDPSSPDDIAQQVGHVLDKPNLSSTLIHAGKRRARLFTWDRAAQSLSDIITNFTLNATRRRNRF